jgi:hypothetical protein
MANQKIYVDELSVGSANGNHLRFSPTGLELRQAKWGRGWLSAKAERKEG